MKNTMIRAALLVCVGMFSVWSVQAQEFRWAKKLDNNAIISSSNSVKYDTASNALYVYGYFEKTIDLDPDPAQNHNVTPPYTGTGTQNVFLTKLDTAGRLIWGRTFHMLFKPSGTIGAAAIGGVDIDGEGNVYITGMYTGNMFFGMIGNDSAFYQGIGTSSMYIVKFNAGGTLLWVKTISGNTTNAKCTPSDISVDKRTGDVYVGGNIGVNPPVPTPTITVDFDPDINNTYPITTLGQNDIFILKLDKDGSFVWVNAFRSSVNDILSHLNVMDGYLYMNGSTGGTIDIDPSANTNNVSGGILAKFDTSGALIWSVGGVKSGSSMCIDGQSNIYMSATFSGTVDFNPDPVLTDVWTHSPPMSDIFISKFDSSGVYQWTRVLETPATNSLSSSPSVGGIAVDEYDYLYITGAYRDAIDMDPAVASHVLQTPTISSTDKNVFIARYNAGGDLIWAVNLGNDHTDEGLDLAVDPWGNVYNTGWFTYDVDFDPGPDSFKLSAGNTLGNYLLKLSACNVSGTELYDTSCAAGYVFYGDTLTAAGTYVRRYPNAAGCDSSIVLHLTITSDPHIRELYDTSCSAIYVFDHDTLTASGTYTFPYLSAAGCDSNILLHLTLPAPDARLTVNENVLGTTQPYIAYQWLRNSQKIDGATNSVYTVTENDDYSVVVTTREGCTDTSNVHTVNNLSVSDTQSDIFVRVYPNPAQDRVYISASVPVTATLSSMEGRVVLHQDHASGIDLSGVADGVYMLRITDAQGYLLKTEKVVKQARR